MVELIIYSFLLLVVVAIAGGLLANVLRAGNGINSANSQTTSAQLVANSITTGISNASAVSQSFPASTYDATANPDGDVLIMARTQDRALPSPDSWKCEAWFYDGAEHSIYTTTSDSAIAMPAAGPAGSWTLLASGVSAHDSSHAPISATSYSVSMNLKLAPSGAGSPSLVDSTVFTRNVAVPESDPCFAS